jgi:hypothetical protein
MPPLPSSIRESMQAGTGNINQPGKAMPTECNRVVQVVFSVVEQGRAARKVGRNTRVAEFCNREVHRAAGIDNRRGCI